MLVQLLEDDRDFITGIHSPKSLSNLGPCEDLRKAEKLKKKAQMHLYYCSVEVSSAICTCAIHTSLCISHHGALFPSTYDLQSQGHLQTDAPSFIFHVVLVLLTKDSVLV